MKHLLYRLLAGFTLASATVAATAAPPPPAVRVPQLSLDTALHIARVAIKTCRGKGVSVAVTVLDRGGNPQVVLRDTYASVLTLKISREKAYAALSFRAPTSALSARARTPLGQVPGILMLPGAIPIQAGGELLGAVGVSGAPSGTIDVACAKAGVAAVQTELELAGF